MKRTFESASAQAGLLLSAAAISLPLLSLNCSSAEATDDLTIDRQLATELHRVGFTGRIGETLERRLGRPIDQDLADLGAFLFFDKIMGLHDDNSCAGCHAPAAGFGDFESIAIGVNNNDIVGPNRAGPRNQRRTPMVLNNAFYPKLMWNGRFFAPSGDPFDNSQGFVFPDPEGTGKFPPNDPEIKTLLAAQGHIPGTELPELAGFTGQLRELLADLGSATQLADGPAAEAENGGRPSFQLSLAGGHLALAGDGSDEPDFVQFDDGQGTALPPPATDGMRNEPIRALLERRLNDIPAYRELFARQYPEVAAGKPITFAMVAQALAEFQLTLTFADAPIDRFARGETDAMTPQQKRGALVFFGKAGCVDCHAVAGQANEMFSDFEMYNIGVPQFAPKFGKGTGNVPFRDSDGEVSETGIYDFGLAEITDPPNEGDRFRFRTSPLRNVHLQPTFFHNGSFTRLEDAIWHHLEPVASARAYDPAEAGVDADLWGNTAPIDPILAGLDPLVQRGVVLTDQEFADLVEFVRFGLLDPRATPGDLMRLMPTAVPSGRPLQIFEFPRITASLD
jgi:cytochrome c peroxidase